MTKIEYIRQSHKLTNRKLKEWLKNIPIQLKAKSTYIAIMWQAAMWIIFGFVSFISWLAFIVTLFKDLKFNLHYMECEISASNFSVNEANTYLLNKKQEYTRALSYGSISTKEQRRIDKTFEYLFSIYPTQKEEEKPDYTAERHTEVIEHISEVKSVVKDVAAYTDQKSREEAIRKEREAAQLEGADKKRSNHLLRRGFEHNPSDFCPKLNDDQIEAVIQTINDLKILTLKITNEEFLQLLLCNHTEPLQTNNNKMLAMLLDQLSTKGLITPKWQRIAEHNRCFISKMGKPISAKDLSSAKLNVGTLPQKHYDAIEECIEEL